MMRTKKWLYACLALPLALGSASLADDHGRGRHRGEDEDRERWVYSDHDRHEMRDWYDEHGDDLPPGLAKRDELPPGLERQLRIRGTLPPGLRRRMRPCPEELERRLPPAPPQCAHTVIGGHIVLVNTHTFLVLDIFHFER